LCVACVVLFCLSFFFQAEDGIRDDLVTGVQTCALPISYCSGRSRWSREAIAPSSTRPGSEWRWNRDSSPRAGPITTGRAKARARSEERRVGKEGRGRVAAKRGRRKRGRGTKCDVASRCE